MRVLLIEDDASIAGAIIDSLDALGWDIVHEAAGLPGLERLESDQWDVLLLDLGLPDLDGIEVARRARELGTFPIIVISARGDEGDRVLALELGADDYLPKPFEPEELALRAAAILRRLRNPDPPREIEMSGLVFDLRRGCLLGPSGPIRLTESEQQLLSILARHAGEPVSREMLAAGPSSGTERSIDVQVTRLRKKIEPDPKITIHIQTVRGIGYRLMPD